MIRFVDIILQQNQFKVPVSFFQLTLRKYLNKFLLLILRDVKSVTESVSSSYAVAKPLMKLKLFYLIVDNFGT